MTHTANIPNIPVESPIETKTRNDSYVHLRFTEQDNLPLAHEAWRIHAEGYRAMGFVGDDAITEEGFMASDIDKARGENVEYFMDINPLDDTDKAAVRKKGISLGGDYRQLPAYALCKDTLYPGSEEFLASIPDQGNRLKEIGALARTKNSSPLSVHELFRAIVQSGMENNEVWFFSIVSTTYDSLVKSFGERNFHLLGDGVALGDERVSDGVRLLPVYVDATTFVENIWQSYKEAETFIDKTRLKRSFVSMIDGIDPEVMSDGLHQAVEEMYLERATRE